MHLCLVDRVVEKISEGIAAGVYRVGMPLPSRTELARRLGVGERTVRTAMARLEACGMVEVRRRVGALVLKRTRSWQRRIFLDVRSEDNGSCSGAMFSLGVRRTVEKAGCRYRDVQLSFDVHSGLDLIPLEEALEEKPNFVLIRAPNCRLPEVAGLVAERGFPYVTVSNVVVVRGNCVGNVCYDASHAVAEFVQDCVRARIRSVLQLDFGEDSYISAREELEAHGIAFERLQTPNGSNYENLDALVKDAAQVMSRRIQQGPLPDLVFLTDDFLSSGAIAALYRAGLKMPEDVRVVAYANRGAGFGFLHTMACFETDTYQEGVNCAKSALRYLKSGVFKPYATTPVYRRGLSFPVH